jgi:16S rRNA (cytidine1402-2'-O)-methyltransferase
MLYVVGTPIGNLEDMTLRALSVLKSVDLIAAEDTRHSGNLLRHFEIRKPLVSYHEHNEARRAVELCERLAAGENIALITDAGMPGLSDPGIRLVRQCLVRQLAFTVVPGVSAVTTALLGSGFDLDGFTFRGFLPVKTGQRARELTLAKERTEMTLFFESPYRLTKTLAACAEIMPDRRLCVARELTKKFEEFRRGTANELLAQLVCRNPAGAQNAATIHKNWSRNRVVHQLQRRGGFLLVKLAQLCDVPALFPRLWLTQLSRPEVGSIASRRATPSMLIFSKGSRGTN